MAWPTETGDRERARHRVPVVWCGRAALWLAACLPILLGTAGCGGQQQHSVDPSMPLATVSGEEERALLMLELERSGPSAELLHGVGASYWRSGATDSARIFLERALELDRAHAPTLAWLSRLYYEEGELERGIELLTPVVDAGESLEPDLLVNLAVLELAWGNIDTARSLLERSVREYPEYAPAYGNLGYLEMQLGDNDAARRSLEAAVERDPQVPEFHNNLGIIHRRDGQHQQAAEQFENAIVVDPKFREAHHNLALLYKLYLLDEDRARRHFRSFIALGGTADDAVIALFHVPEGESR